MKSVRTALLLTIALALSACGGVKESLGLGRSAPDEFAVVDRPPLSMPPDYGLKPPTPGAARPQDVDLTAHAEETLFGPKDAALDHTDASDSEKALLEQTGADKAPPDIRNTINREAAQKVVGNEHLLQDLLWWKKDPLGGSTVDAPAEAARIKDAKNKGETLNQGATPIIEQDKSGFLGL